MPFPFAEEERTKEEKNGGVIKWPCEKTVEKPVLVQTWKKRGEKNVEKILFFLFYRKDERNRKQGRIKF